MGAIFRDGEHCQYGEENPANHGAVCPNEPIHVIGGGDEDGRIVRTLLLCHEHFLKVQDEGLITETFIGSKEFQRRGGQL